MPQKFKATISFPELSSKNPKAEAKVSTQKVSRGARRKRSRNSNHERTVGQSKTGNAPAAFSARGASLIRAPGMSNLPEITFSYQTGTLQFWVPGTSTSTTNANFGFFVENTGGYLNLNSVPIAPADANVGQSYITDVMKHFQRRIVHKIHVSLESTFPNTGTSNILNNSSVSYAPCLSYIAPIRGGNVDPNWVPTTPSGIVSYPIIKRSDVLSMSGNKPFYSWESVDLDLTPYIAGGSGARQNEFNISNSSSQIQSVTVTTNSLVCPAAFSIGGYGNFTNGVTSNYLVVTHIVRVTTTVSLLDYTGNFNVFTTNSPPSLRRDDFVSITQDHISNSSKEETSKPLLPHNALDAPCIRVVRD